MFKSKYFLIGFLLLLVITIPLTLYFVSMQLEVRSRAEATSTLALTTSLTEKNAQGQWIASVGQEFTVDVMVNPGSNAVQTVRFSLLFDSLKLQATKITPDTTSFPTTTTDPTIKGGSASIEVGVMAGNPSAQIQTAKKVATVTFKALATTTAPTKIVFDPSFTRVTGGQNVAAVNENVLLLPLPELPIVINQTTPTPTGPTPTGPTPTGPTPTEPTGTITPTVSSSPTEGTLNQAPTCTAMNVDRETAGTSPFSITFTANGNDPDGVINKVTFDFGDGPVQDVVDGLGTKTISVQVAHTYHNPGTYHATATLTDNSNALSDSTTCSQTIVVSSGSSSGTGTTTTTTGTTTTEATATPTQAVAQASATMAATGNITTTFGVVGGILVTIIGGFLLLAL